MQMNPMVNTTVSKSITYCKQQNYSKAFCLSNADEQHYLKNARITQWKNPLVSIAIESIENEPLKEPVQKYKATTAPTKAVNTKTMFEKNTHLSRLLNV